MTATVRAYRDDGTVDTFDGMNYVKFSGIGGEKDFLITDAPVLILNPEVYTAFVLDNVPAARY